MSTAGCPILRAFGSCEGWGFRLPSLAFRSAALELDAKLFVRSKSPAPPSPCAFAQMARPQNNLRTAGTSTVPFLYRVWPLVQLFFLSRPATVVREKKNMKHFRRFRDDRFALTTLQNPLCEVRTRAQLIEAAQKALGLQPDVADIPATPPLAAPQPPPAAEAPHNARADQKLQPT